MGHEDLGAGVSEDVADFRADQVVVDRHEIPTGLEAGEVELNGLNAVREHGGDDVTFGQAESSQCVDDLIGSTEEFTRCQLGPIWSHHREVVGVLVR